MAPVSPIAVIVRPLITEIHRFDISKLLFEGSALNPIRAAARKLSVAPVGRSPKPRSPHRGSQLTLCREIISGRGGWMNFVALSDTLPATLRCQFFARTVQIWRPDHAADD
jgi:hypothetical protein